LHAINELLAGRIDLIVSDMAAAEFVQSGQLHALAVTTAARQNALPGVPSLAEFLPGYDAMTWYGLGVPKQTPGAIIQQLNAATNAVLGDPAKSSRLTGLGFTLSNGSSEDFARLFVAETAKWSKIVSAANIKPE
jgi:tripartite-type tricarboxylate transporter receptor subunit TctC